MKIIAITRFSTRVVLLAISLPRNKKRTKLRIEVVRTARKLYSNAVFIIPSLFLRLILLFNLFVDFVLFYFDFVFYL